MVGHFTTLCMKGLMSNHSISNQGCKVKKKLWDCVTVSNFITKLFKYQERSIKNLVPKLGTNYSKNCSNYIEVTILELSCCSMSPRHTCVTSTTFLHLNRFLTLKSRSLRCVKSVRTRAFLVRIYFVNLRIYFECGKIRTRITPSGDAF